SRRREPPPFGGFVKKELDCLILCWGALNCLLVRRSITGRRTGRQRDGRQSPAEVAGMITGAEQRDQGEQEDDQRAGHPAEKAGDEQGAVAVGDVELVFGGHPPLVPFPDEGLRRILSWPRSATRTARAYAPPSAARWVRLDRPVT